MEEQIDRLEAELDQILSPEDDLVHSSSMPGRKLRLIRGKMVELTKVPAMVLEILETKDEDSQGTGWFTKEEIRRRLKAMHNKQATERSVVQSIYHIRRAFADAKLPSNLILCHDGKWKLNLSDMHLADISHKPDSA